MKKILFAGALLFVSLASSAFAAPSVYIEDLTWPEVKARMDAGAKTIIIPTGGTEQNGLHMVIGKHNMIVHYTSGKIAEALGNALVAPVLAYTPEGPFENSGHMHFPGTISLSDDTFKHVLEDAARSMKLHGFTLICFIGDHGGNQKPQAEAADELNSEWKNSGVRVLQVADYYDNGQIEYIKKLGLGGANPGAHAGILDTSEVMAIDPSGVRDHLRGVHNGGDFNTTGAMGDSSQASPELGRKLLQIKIDAAVRQIRAAQAAP